MASMQTCMINRILAVMWPTLTKAIITEVMKQAKPQLEKQVFEKVGQGAMVMVGWERCSLQPTSKQDVRQSMRSDRKQEHCPCLHIGAASTPAFWLH